MRISLIVPTRERAPYLRECLATACAVRDADVEIVVSDNASEDDTRSVVEAIGDPRIRYLNTGSRVSMRQNFEFALERSTGDYVIYIGDDDAFLPGQFAALRTLLERDRPDVVSWKPLTYGWPIPGFGRRVGGVRFARSQVLGPPREVPLGAGRAALLRCDLARIGPRPAAYHGCVARSYLDSIRDRCGQAFRARSPDVFFSYFVMLTHPSVTWTGHSFTISGHSPASTGNAGHAYASSDPRALPAVRFMREAERDPVQDAIETTLPSPPINTFGSFETARLAAGVDPTQVDFVAWYAYVRGATDPSDGTVLREVESLLQRHAQEHGTGEQLLLSRSERPRVHAVSKASSRLLRNLTSIKCSAEHAGLNTVRTAAELVDEVLGDEYLAMARSGAGPGLAWPRTYARALRRKLRPVR